MAPRAPRDIFDVGPPAKEPVDRSAVVPAGSWVPREPTDEDARSFDDAAEYVQQQTAKNAARYVYELELMAVAWRDDVTVMSTSAKAAMHLLSLAAGAPEKRNKPTPKSTRIVDELRKMLTGDDEDEA